MLPALSSESVTPAGLRWTFAAPGLESAFYGGHFPGHPILPGVVALGWMMTAAERFLGRKIDSAELLNVKFQQVILPGAALELTIAPHGADRLRATLSSGAGQHASALIPRQEA